MTRSAAAFKELTDIRNLMPPVADEVSIAGSDLFFRTPFCIGETVAAVLAATGVAANGLWEQRNGRRQRVAVSVREAAASLHGIRNGLCLCGRSISLV